MSGVNDNKKRLGNFSPPSQSAKQHKMVLENEKPKDINDVYAVLKEIKSGQDSLRNKMDTRFQDMTASFDNAIASLKEEITLDVSRMENRLIEVEKKIRNLESAPTKQEFDPEVTVVIQHLNYMHGEDTKQKVREVFTTMGVMPRNEDGTEGDDATASNKVTIVRVKRLDQRDPGRPPIVKVELKNKDEKMMVLQNKSLLRNDGRFRKVYIRTSMSHEERVAQLNMRTLLGELGMSQKFRFTGSGRLVQKLDNQNPNNRAPGFAEVAGNSNANQD